MLRTSLKTVISLAPQTWLMCLLRQTTRRVLFIILALVVYHAIKELQFVAPPLSSDLSGWSILGVASPLAHRRFSPMIRFEIRSWGNDLDHFHYFSHDLWYGDVENLLHGALLNALLWDRSHNFNDLVHDFRNVLHRHLRHVVGTQPPKITILAYISQFLSRRVGIERVRGVTSSVSSLEYPNVVSWSPAPTSRSSWPTLIPPVMSALCLLMRMALAAFVSASGRHFVRDRQSSCAMPRSWRRAARPNPLDLSCCLHSKSQIICVRLAPNREHS